MIEITKVDNGFIYKDEYDIYSSGSVKEQLESWREITAMRCCGFRPI